MQNFPATGQTSSDENGRTMLLLTVGFFIGISIATLNVGASTLFLDQFDERTYLPKAIIASGLIGVVFTYLFAFFESRTRFVSLSVVFLLIIMAITSLLRLGLFFQENSKWLIFIAFACISPFTSVAFLIFWGAFGRIFSLRESKRIIGRIDSGQLIASIVALFTIPVILNFLPDTADLLWVSAVSFSLLICTILVINKRYNINRRNMQDLRTSGQKHNFITFFKNPYILLMAVFINIAMIAIFFVDYSFLAATAEQFPEPRHLANFISLFSGTVVIFSFLIQNFVTDRIINMYGLKVSLLINPLLLIFFTLLAALVGSVFGYSKQSDMFLIFFLAISLGKMFATSLKDALDSPTFKLYFLPLDAAIRFNIQTRIEGVVTVFSGLVAGSILLAINLLHAFELIHFTYFLLPIIGAWLYMISRLYRRYRHTLEDTLSAIKHEKEFRPRNDDAIDAILMNELAREKRPEQIMVILKLIVLVEPELMDEVLESVKQLDDSTLQRYVSQFTDRHSITITLTTEQEGKTSGENGVSRNTAFTISNSVRNLGFHSLGTSTLQKLAKSKSPVDRATAANLLAKVLNDTNSYILLELLRDSDSDVRKAAIATARKTKKVATWPILVELLASPVYAHAATVALIEAGEDVVPNLELAFHKTGQHTHILVKIVHIYSRIGGEKAQELLWSKIDYPDKRLVSSVLKALKYCQAVATGEKVTIAHRLIETEIGIAAWNQAALLEIADTPYNSFLKQALEEEMAANFDRIFTLLSLLYDPLSIQLVRDNIESQISENTVYALELLDVFIDRNIRAMLFPLLDDIPPEEEVSIYQSYFPRERLNATEVLIHILNRDFNQLNHWTKACAIFSMAHTPDLPVTDDLIAQVFNPDRLLRETAAWAIKKISPDAYQQLSGRINKQVLNELDHILVPITGNEREAYLHLFIEKVFFLKQVALFSSIPAVLLVELAECMDVVSFQTGSVVVEPDKNFQSPIYCIVDGTIEWQHDNETIAQMDEHEAFGNILTKLPNEPAASAVAVNPVTLYRIEYNAFYHLITKHPVFLQECFHAISEAVTEEASIENLV